MIQVDLELTFTPHSKHKVLSDFCCAFSNALQIRDAYTQLHSKRVMGISVSMAQTINFSKHDISLIEIASSLHDIGKIAIPDSLLLKPTVLDEDEMTIVRTHADIGAAILDSFTHQAASVVASAIRHHHERYDGLGYPSGLAADHIPLMSRIITIADNYDAMAVRRVYQNGRSHQEILDIMQSESGSKHDPGLLELFFKIIEKPENSAYKA